MAIFSATQRCNIVATLFRMVTTLFQNCISVLREKSSLRIVPCKIALKLPETSKLHVLWRKCRSRVPVTFFSLPLIFTSVAASISHFLTAATKFLCRSSNKKMPTLLFSLFLLSIALFLVELRWLVAYFPFFSVFLFLYIIHLMSDPKGNS